MTVKLTQFSKASGCGCKIAPAVLEEILTGCKQDINFKNLLVGNETKDDAAVYDLEDGNCIISTTDFSHLNIANTVLYLMYLVVVISLQHILLMLLYLLLYKT